MSTTTNRTNLPVMYEAAGIVLTVAAFGLTFLVPVAGLVLSLALVAGGTFTFVRTRRKLWLGVAVFSALILLVAITNVMFMPQSTTFTSWDVDVPQR